MIITTTITDYSDNNRHRLFLCLSPTSSNYNYYDDHSDIRYFIGLKVLNIIWIFLIFYDNLTLPYVINILSVKCKVS